MAAQKRDRQTHALIELQHRSTNLTSAWKMVARRHGDICDMMHDNDDAKPGSARRKPLVHDDTATSSSLIKSVYNELSKGTHHPEGDVSIYSRRQGLQDLLSQYYKARLP